MKFMKNHLNKNQKEPNEPLSLTQKVHNVSLEHSTKGNSPTDTFTTPTLDSLPLLVPLRQVTEQDSIFTPQDDSTFSTLNTNRTQPQFHPNQVIPRNDDPQREPSTLSTPQNCQQQCTSYIITTIISIQTQTQLRFQTATPPRQTTVRTAPHTQAQLKFLRY